MPRQGSLNSTAGPPITDYNANTHRRRRRRHDSTVELSCVGVASASAVCIEFATSSRRLPTTADENLETEHVENLSCRVELCWRCVHTRRLSWHSLQFCSLYVTAAENWKLGHDWRLVRSHRRHDATRLRCRQMFRLIETRLDCRQLVARSIHTADATQLSASAVCIGLNMLTTSIVNVCVVFVVLNSVIKRVKRCCCTLILLPKSTLNTNLTTTDRFFTNDDWQRGRFENFESDHQYESNLESDVRFEMESNHEASQVPSHRGPKVAKMADFNVCLHW